MAGRIAERARALMVALTGLGLSAMPGAGVAGAETVFETSAGPVRVERIAGDLDTPWALAFLPGGGRLVTELGGRLWHFPPGGARVAVRGVPEVVEIGQGGLMDVVVASDFADSRRIFLTYAAPDAEGTRTTLAAARLSADGRRLEGLEVLFRQTPVARGGRHFGSRVVEAPDGTLWVTLGDRGTPEAAQSLDGTLGKVLRVGPDGRPAGAPSIAARGGHPAIWSLGHRNPQGAALDGQGRLWTVSHGARGGDEINRPEAGRNHGWPEISYGTEYSGAPFPGTHAPGMEQPRWVWDPSIAPSGLAILSGRLWPDWEGDLFVGALKAERLVRIGREGETLGAEERLLDDRFGRIRDVREGPEGALWFLTDASDGALYRITPAE